MPTPSREAGGSELQLLNADSISLHRTRGGVVLPHQIGDIEPRNFASFDRPASTDHDSVGPVRAAQDKRGKRVAVAGEAKLIELEEREIG